MLRREFETVSSVEMPDGSVVTLEHPISIYRPKSFQGSHRVLTEASLRRHIRKYGQDDPSFWRYLKRVLARLRGFRAPDQREELKAYERSLVERIFD